MKFEEISLADAVEFIVDNRGKSVPVVDTGFPLIATNCISNNRLYPEFKNLRYVSQDIYDNWFRSHPLPNDVIITNKGSQNGAVCLVPNPVTFCIAQDMVALRAKKGIVYPFYLLAALRSEQVQSRIKNLNVDAVIPHLKKTDFNKLFFPLPDYETQIAIGDFYFRVCSKIELNIEINQTLEQMAHAIYKSWLVDFEPVKAKITALEAGGSEKDALFAAMKAISGKEEAELTRLQAEQPEQYTKLLATAQLFPSAIEDSELGEIPVGWSHLQVNELATIKGGKQRSRDLISEIGSVPVFGGAGIMGYTDEHNADGFVISVGRVGAYCGQFFSHRGPAWINNNASLISPSNMNHGEWLFIVLRNTSLDPIKKGAAQPFVSNSDIGKLHLVWPGDDVVEAFTHQLRKLFLMQESLLKQSGSLSTLTDTILPELLSGRLDKTVNGV